ncbi:MAG: HAD-IA family hydrolase [Bacillota bacterium]|nr:HAD-IA family hydrolase [Bacillota bacterium]
MRAFLFDLDGTLNDSVPLICYVSQLAYAELGLERSLEQIKQTIGVPLVKTGEEIFGPGKGDIYRLSYQRHYNEVAERFPLQAFPGILDMLAELRAAGAKLAVVTSKRHRLTLENLESTGLLPFLDVVVDAQSTEKHKPDPEPALLALEELGCGPEQGIFIGDSVFDLGCGRNAGMQVMGVSWGAGSRQELADFRPEYLCDSVAEMRQQLLSLLKLSC